MTVRANKVPLNITFDGFLLMVLSIMMEKSLLLGKNTQFNKWSRKKPYPVRPKIDTLFMTLSATHTYMAHIRAYPSANSTHPVAATAGIVKFHYMVEQQT